MKSGLSESGLSQWGLSQSGSSKSGSSKPRSSLALRIVALVVLVGVLVAVVAGFIAVGAVQRTAVDATREQLSEQADLLSAFDGAELPTYLATLSEQGIWVVSADPAVASDLVARAVVLKAAGASRVQFDGATYLLESRAGESGGFTLVTKTDRAAVTSQALIRRILWALVAGLVIAVPAGLVLARLLSRPLRRSAEVATAMSGGRRDLRVQVGGSSEIAAVAVAVNQLADALADSEDRQQRFLASVSHELRTPLAAVSGLADALSDGMIAPDEVEQVGRTIRAETARLVRMVSDLLDLARLGTSEFRLSPEPVDLNALVTEAAQVWQVRCDRRQVRLILELPDAAVTVVADPRRLRQVLDGLAENALRALVPEQPLVLAVSDDADGGRMEVRDGGPGLMPADYPVAFEAGVLHERYRRVRPAGAGLGLALAHGLVTRMGGTIDAGPAPEGGARFTIRLPKESHES